MQLQDGLRVNLTRHEVIDEAGTSTSLTVLEVDALRVLAAAAGQPVLRKTLEYEVWGFRAGTRSEAVPVAMRRLRAKIGAALQTVRGVGWRLDVAPTQAPDATETTDVAPLPATAWFPRPDLEEAVQRLLTQGTRWVALVGPVGAGKSRLAHEMTAEHARVYVPVPGATLTSAQLCDALATSMGLASSAIDAMLGAVSTRQETLLWVDDAQALAPDVLDTLERLARVALVVVTVREAPVHRSSAVIEVGPLPLTQARAFFVERATQSTLSDRALEEVLTLVDGLPGPLEMAAAQAWLGESLLLEQLAESPIDTMMEKAWSTLSAPAIDAMLVCAVLAVPVSARALLNLVGTLASLPELRRRALLHVNDGGELVALAPVRRFCALQPDPRGVRRAAQEKVLAWGEQWVERLTREPAEAIARLAQLHQALRNMAMEGPPELRARAAITAAVGLRYSGSVLSRVNLLRAVLGDVSNDAASIIAMRRELAWALRAMAATRAEVEPLIEGDPHPAATRLRALYAHSAGEHRVARELFQQVLVDCQPDTPTYVFALVQGATRQDLRTRASRSARRAALSRALELANTTVQLCLPEVLRSTALDHFLDGEVREARAMLGRAIDVAQHNGQPQKLPLLWNTMGMTLAEADVHAAQQAFLAALEHARHLGNGLIEPVARSNLALCLYCDDKPAEALAAVQPVAGLDVHGTWRQLCMLICYAAHRACGNVEAAQWRDRINLEMLGRAYSSSGAVHGHAMLTMADAADAIAAEPTRVEAVQAALAATEAEALEPSAGALRMLRAHATRAVLHSTQSSER